MCMRTKFQDTGTTCAEETTLQSLGQMRGMGGLSEQVECSLRSEILVVSPVHAEAAILVAVAAYRPLAIHVVFNLDLLCLRLGNVGCEGHEQFAGDALLDGHASARILIAIAGEHRIDRQMRDACNLFQSAGDLAG